MHRGHTIHNSRAPARAINSPHAVTGPLERSMHADALWPSKKIATTNDGAPCAITSTRRGAPRGKLLHIATPNPLNSSEALARPPFSVLRRPLNLFPCTLLKSKPKPSPQRRRCTRAHRALHTTPPDVTHTPSPLKPAAWGALGAPSVTPSGHFGVTPVATLLLMGRGNLPKLLEQIRALARIQWTPASVQTIRHKTAVQHRNNPNHATAVSWGGGGGCKGGVG